MTAPDPPAPPIAAAGAVVLRRHRGSTQVLVVHGVKYDDWALPKGKLDADEDPRSAAIREVLEETGVQVRLGPPLPTQAYTFHDRSGTLRYKVIHYWVGRPVAGSAQDVSAYSPNDEIVEVRWVDVDDVPTLLTHERDADLVTAALAHERSTTALLVVRHAESRERSRWRFDDRTRPLDDRGAEQAELLVPLLRAYGVRRLVSSSSRRCSSTVQPYAEAAHVPLDTLDGLSEEDATGDGVTALVEECLAEVEPTALCSHRKVLPLLWQALGVEQRQLAKGGTVVVHHRRGRLAALERVPAP